MRRTRQIGKYDPTISHLGDWTGLVGGSAVERATASVANSVYDRWSFGGTGLLGRTLASTSGAGAVELAEHVHFEYGKRMDASTAEDAVDGFGDVAGGIYDTGLSGEFPSGKSLRLIHRDVNVATPSGSGGLGLKVFAQDLGRMVTPPCDKVYVDPRRGLISMPQPAQYCSYLYGRLSNPEVGKDYRSSYSAYCDSSLGAAVVDASYNNILAYMNDHTGGYTAWITYNPILTRFDDPSTGSIFATLATAGGYRSKGNDTRFESHTYIYINSNTYLRMYSPSDEYGVQLIVVVDGGLVYASGWDYVLGGWYRFGVSWDCNNHLLRVYITGSLLGEWTFNGAAPVSSYPYVHAYSHTYDDGDYPNETSPYGLIDNLVIWRDFDDDGSIASMDYNYGSSYRKHPIYGAANNYTIGTVEVGYHYIGGGTSPAVCPKPDSNEEILREDAALPEYGRGLFGAPRTMSTSSYADVVQGTDFEYDYRLDAVSGESNGFGTVLAYDTCSGEIVSGELDGDAWCRIIEDGKNITDPAGLALQVYARRLAGEVSPPATQCYIDPLRGEFMLPRPIWFSRCESLYTITIKPEIQHPDFAVGSTDGMVTSGEFGSAWLVSSDEAVWKRLELYPYGRSLDAPTEGTLSCWCRNNGQVLGRGIVQFSVGNIQAKLEIHPGGVYGYGTGVALSVNGDFVSDIVPLAWTDYVHLYIVWKQAGLTGGKTIRVFVNGVEIISTTAAMTLRYYDEPSLVVGAWSLSGSAVGVAIDNIKLFGEAVSEDPSWEYNGGAGNEYGLHPIYGAANGYAPVLTTTGGVSYYKAGGRNTYLRLEV